MTSCSLTSRVLNYFYSKCANVKTFIFFGFSNCDFQKLFAQPCRTVSGESYITSMLYQVLRSYIKYLT